jgi:hypothetical protein
MSDTSRVRSVRLPVGSVHAEYSPAFVSLSSQGRLTGPPPPACLLRCTASRTVTQTPRLLLMPLASSSRGKDPVTILAVMATGACIYEITLSSSCNVPLTVLYCSCCSCDFRAGRGSRTSSAASSRTSHTLLMATSCSTGGGCGCMWTAGLVLIMYRGCTPTHTRMCTLKGHYCHDAARHDVYSDSTNRIRKAPKQYIDWAGEYGACTFMMVSPG